MFHLSERDSGSNDKQSNLLTRTITSPRNNVKRLIIFREKITQSSKPGEINQVPDWFN